MSPAYKFPWKRASREDLSPYAYPGRPQNKILTSIREKEKANPAPFSDRTLIRMDNSGAPDFEKPFNFTPFLRADWVESTENLNIPVCQILGCHSTNNLDNYQPGDTFKEVLFESLHGLGIIEESSKFLVGPASKDIEMPHVRDPEVPKSGSHGPLILSQYGDWFFIKNGQQRGIIAMYLIWQKYGDKGLLKNVKVNSYIPKHAGDV
ncbi:hypothetical protein A7E78_03765 [Syntrophotalea acetylenivorans]|uniref:Uncharacterized protein n=1 Tax=Syntrophotalea acetylenivorans TaxID=1842532 RepID=A0A1L3GMA8_9BACT|nr:hypothetical protein [Syntrophotalea acetylenivorans]APG27025.1 hypothetical protein A7E78_03765 [Syntrophotalea acetylenivorans]